MTDSVAVVTGAAGGIGEAVARLLGERGTPVALVDREPGRLEETRSRLAASGLPAEAFPADVTSAADVAAMVDAVERRLGPVGSLVNAAGVLRLGRAADLSEEDWLSTFAVNSTGVFLVSRAVAGRMVPRGRGAIVTVASNAGAVPRTEMAAYAASKAAAVMFTKCLGLEVARYGIRCNVVAPGSTDTPMLTSMWHDESGPAGTIQGRPEEFRVGIPLRRIALPADVAQAVAFLLSDAASHITLGALTVDGGAALGV